MFVLPKWFLAFLDKIWIVHTKYFEMFDNHVWKHTVLKLYINSWNHICNWQDEKKDAKKEQQGVATSGLSLNKKIFCSPILLTAFWTQRKFWFIGYCINMMYQLIHCMCINLFSDDTAQKKAPEEPQEKPAKKRRWGSTKTSTSTDTTQAKTKRLSSIEFSTESLKVGITFDFTLCMDIS